jgi:hypothetical protein
MAIAYILSTDKLQSGFRAKYNLSVAEIITSFTDNGDGTVTAALFGGGTLTMDITSSFYTKSEINALIAGLTPSKSPVEYEYDETYLVEDGAGTGNYYLPYLKPNGDPIPDGVRPYSIASGQGTHEYPIPALVENDDSWTEPRIYGFSNVTQTITIFAL